MQASASLPIALAWRLLPRAEQRRLAGLAYHDEGHGYDVFGLSPAWLSVGWLLTELFYRRWFRVSSSGIEHVPAEGAAVLVANHGGVLPFDGLMLWADVLRRTDPPRVPRPIADNFVPQLPFVGTVFARQGVVGGSRGNVHHLLERGELLLIFPEGTLGVGKPYRDRYRLQAWRCGHAEMAIRHRAPVIPVALLGPDEQYPLAARLPLHLFGAPWVPVSPLPLPLPVHYEIHYGEPIRLHDRYPPEKADDAVAVSAAAEQVRRAEQALLDRALAGRRSRWR